MSTILDTVYSLKQITRTQQRILTIAIIVKVFVTFPNDVEKKYLKLQSAGVISEGAG